MTTCRRHTAFHIVVVNDALGLPVAWNYDGSPRNLEPGPGESLRNVNAACTRRRWHWGHHWFAPVKSDWPYLPVDPTMSEALNQSLP